MKGDRPQQMSEPMLHPGDTFPHIRVRTIDGETFSYSAIWQQKPLVLVVVSASQADLNYASALRARACEFNERETECVITSDDVMGLRTPSVVIADRWGEIVHITDSAALPSADDVIEWIDYIRQRCPECEGEAR
jgi:peroxiredoxin